MEFVDSPPENGKVKGECPGEYWASLGWNTSAESSDPTYAPMRGYHFDGDDHMTLVPGDYMFPPVYTFETWIMFDKTKTKDVWQAIFSKNGDESQGEHNWQWLFFIELGKNNHMELLMER